MRNLNTESLEHIVADAAAVVVSGGTLIGPTDTVYGIACDATNQDAVNAVARMKHRSADMPFIVLLPDEHEMEVWAESMPGEAQRVIHRCAELPVTFIVSASRRAQREIVSCGNTIAIRIPQDRFSLALCRASGVPLLSTSANIHGQMIPSNISEIDSALLTGVDLVVDGGTLNVAPSTMIDMTGASPIITREGSVSRAQLHALCGAFPPNDY